MSDATVVRQGGRASVRLERRLADPPALVWKALTDRDELSKWFPCEVAVAGGVWEVGAAITFTFPAERVDRTWAGEVLAATEPEVLAFTWGVDVLRFELTPDGHGTLLVLVDELPPGAAARNAAGWEVCLDRLEGRALAPDSWQIRFDAYSAAFLPGLGAQEGPPTRH